LIGIQLEKSEQAALQLCFDTLGFVYTEETSNPAYQLFTGGQV